MLLHKLESSLGPRRKKSSTDSVEFCCPKCDPSYLGTGSKKYNLVVTISKGIFHCWSCNWSGTIRKLLYHLFPEDDLTELSSEIIQPQIRKFVKTVPFSTEGQQQAADNNLTITNVRSLTKAWPDSLHYLAAINYLHNRGITDDIIKKWNICYTERGKNKFRILIFSTSEGSINYCVARAFYDTIYPKYINTKVPKHSIIFGEDQIDWSRPVILTEGPFDSIVLWNAIPLLGIASGNEILLYKKLIKRLLENKTPVILAFDADAKEKMFEAYECLESYGIETKIIYLPTRENDISKFNEVYGKEKLVELIKSAHAPTMKEILCRRLHI
jgi:DNA primase